MFFYNFIPSPIIFTLGPLSFHWYGLLLAGAIAAGYILLKKQALEQGKNSREIDSLLIWLTAGGLIGARLFDALFYEWQYFKDNLWEILAFWQPGLSWHGALLGGLIALWWWHRRQKKPLADIFAMLAPLLALGQAIGRWGNYFNQELFGLPTTLPWGILISPELRPLNYLAATHFHPVFFYEFVGLLIIFVFLWRRRRQTKGYEQIASYLILAGLLRLAMEFFRLDLQPVIAGLRLGAWLALISVLVGLVLLIKPKVLNKNAHF